MPLSSVQQYVQKQINGITIAGQTEPLIAYITPPVMDKVGGPPKAYVWGGQAAISRRTMPRGPGFKRIEWMIDIYLNYETNPNRPTVGSVNLDQQFPAIVDAVMWQLWTARMTVHIDDQGNVIDQVEAQALPPQNTSQILAIGEEISIDYPPEKTPATLRMLWYSILLRCRVEEDVQA
jgi:hypothetical protein